MRLAISRSAAPATSLVDLAELARKRGLDGLELVASDLDDVAAFAAPEGSIVAIHVASTASLALERTARAASAVHAPIVAARGVVPPDAIAELDALYRRAGATLFVTHGTDVEEAAAIAEAIDAASATSVRAAWEVDPGTEKLSDAPAVILVTERSLAYVRLRGGGPELPEHDGSGVGGLFSSLALAGFGGTITLVPSSASTLPAWEKWLAGKAKSGCGTAAAKAAASDVLLDMRPVEPRDRLETILGAYRSLRPGRTLHLTLDHDPECMYFTLQATEPEGSFRFDRVESGPEVWRVDVRKVATSLTASRARRALPA